MLKKQTTKTLKDIIWPPYCVGCLSDTSKYSDFHRYLCPDCLEKIKKQTPDKCPVCNQKNLHDFFLCKKCQQKFTLQGIIIASNYKNQILKEAIHTFKYRKVKSLSYILASLLVTKLSSFFEQRSDKGELAPSYFDWLLVPVPTTAYKKRKRGFNQAEILARRLNETFEIPIKTDIIKKVQPTTPQMELKDADKRKKNLKNAFSLSKDFNKKKLRGRKIILVDDVTTTATTLEECARILAPLAHEVWGAVIAK